MEHKCVLGIELHPHESLILTLLEDVLSDSRFSSLVPEKELPVSTG
jgi:hypothetical protein